MASIFDYRTQQTEINALAQADAEGRQDFLRAAADMGAHRLDAYNRRRKAYGGEHQTVLSSRQRMYLQRLGFVWSENFCETIVDWMVDRLKVEGFSADLNTDTESDSEETAEADLAETVNGWWRTGRMDEIQAIVHEEAAVLGDAFVIQHWDNAEQRPCWVYNRPENIKPVYSPDQPGLLLYVSKVWNSSLDIGGQLQPIRRLNLYFPDRIEKWYSLSTDGQDTPAQWHAWLDADDYDDTTDPDTGEASRVAQWPIPWVDETGEPLGIPVVHFRNKPAANGWGRSEIDGVVPQNEALNKLVQDLFDVVDYLGAPVPYVTGMEGEMDRQFVVGEWLKIPAADATVGMLPGADPAGILAAITGQLQRLAARSRTPLHALVDTGQLPSGEALKASEAPGVKKAMARQTPHGNSWSDTQRLNVKLANHFGKAGLPDDVTFDVNWESAETRNDQAEATTAGLKHDLGVSKYTLLSEMGYDPEEEAERRKDEADEAMAQQEAQLSAGLLGAGAYRGSQDAPTKPDPTNTPPKVPASGSA